MSREKQIEERVELSDIIDYAMRDWDNYIDECREEEIPPIDTFEEWIADVVLRNGYRKQEWISVEERLPEDGVWVLGYSAKSGRGGLCNCLKSYVREFGNYDDTTHWLPLPEFPKKKGE